MKSNEKDADINDLLQNGTFISAHPLALHQNLKMDEGRQRMLSRYYIACGAGGIAVGVHTTQFEIRNPEINLLEPVLRITAEEIEHGTDLINEARQGGAEIVVIPSNLRDKIAGCRARTTV